MDYISLYFFNTYKLLQVPPIEDFQRDVQEIIGSLIEQYLHVMKMT